MHPFQVHRKQETGRPAGRPDVFFNTKHHKSPHFSMRHNHLGEPIYDAPDTKSPAQNNHGPQKPNGPAGQLNRASMTASQPDAFFNAQHPPRQEPISDLHFSMQPRLPYGRPPTGSTRSKQPPRPAGLGGRTIRTYIKSPTDARTHPYSQRSMSHRTIRRPR